MSLQDRAREHAESVAAFVAAARALPEPAWEAPPAPDKWSPAQVAEHLRLTYVLVAAELAGTGQLRRRTPVWMQPFLRLVFLRRMLRTGAIREGVKAPRELRPGPGPFPRPETLAGLEREAATAERALVANPGAVLTHHVFGRLGAPVALRFLAVHNRHHQAQLPPAPT